MGLPLHAWEDFSTAGSRRMLSVLRAPIQELDPAYSDFFWIIRRHLGPEQSELGDLVRGVLYMEMADMKGVEGCCIE